MKPTYLTSLGGALIKALIFGAVLGGLAYYHTYPLFMTTDQLLAVPFSADDRKIKHKIALFVYSRLAKNTPAEKLEYFLPLVLPALIHENRYDEFDKLEASLSPEFREWATYLQTMVLCINELLDQGEYARAGRLFHQIEPRWTNRKFSVLEKIQHKVLLAEYNSQLNSCLDRLEESLNAGKLNADEPRLDQLEQLLAGEPDISSEIKKEMIQNPKWKPSAPFTFLNRAIAQVDGLLPRFGKHMLEHCRRNPAYTPALFDLALNFQGRPAAWPEWKQFIELIGPQNTPDLLCLRDYSRAFFLAALDKQYAKAAIIWRGQILQKKTCPLVIRRAAQELLDQNRPESP